MTKYYSIWGKARMSKTQCKTFFKDLKSKWCLGHQLTEEEKTKLISLIKSYNLEEKVHLIGYKDNVYKYLKNADCFILTSLWEDPGFVLIEAGLSNSIVISSNCKNGPEEILNNENNGYLFKNNDLKDLLRKFDEFKNEDKNKLFKKKLNLKKEIKKFTFYSHFKSLNNIINLNN